MEKINFYGSLGLIMLLFLSFSYSIDAQNENEIEKELLQKAEKNIEKYRKGTVSLQFKAAGDRLKDADVIVQQVNHDFLFGCIIFPLIWDEDPYRPQLFKERFEGLFNFAVFPFYWPSYERQQGMPGWEKMIETLEWCKANDITTKGHPLVWPCRSGVPDWLRNYSIAETEELSKSRVINITSGFKDKIDIWDVVNEPVNVKTWKNKLANIDDQNDWGVEDPIKDIADYVDKAFRWANKGNPGATLILNEFNTIAKQDVRDRFYQLLKELEVRGTPLSGIGIQAHEPREAWYPPLELWATLDKYASFGQPIHITELHPQSSGKSITGGWRKGTWDLETQAEFTEQFVRLCFGHPSVASVNWWGFSDRRIWLPGGGLLDESYQPKPVYERMRKLIHEEWNTSFTNKLTSDGTLEFRAFFGDYKITIKTNDGKTHTFPVQVRKNEANEWTFSLDW